MCPRRAGFSAIVLLALTACGSQASADVADAECGFPPGAPLSFAGEASLRDLHLHAGLDGEGTVYISREPIVPVGVFPDVAVAPARLYCIVYPESAGLRTEVGPLPDGWTPPASPRG